MSIQQSINQSILSAGALYSQSAAAEQRKERIADEKYFTNLQKTLKTQVDTAKTERTSAIEELKNAKDLTEMHEKIKTFREKLPRFEDFYETAATSIAKGQDYYLNKGDLDKYSKLKTQAEQLSATHENEQATTKRFLDRSRNALSNALDIKNANWKTIDARMRALKETNNG